MLISLFESFRAHNWKILGLSHPSLKAEWEKINLVGSLKVSNFSLFFKIKSYAEASLLPFEFESSLSSFKSFFLSLLK